MSKPVVAPSPSPLAGVKRALYRSPTARYVYARARSPFDRREGGRLFSNADDYVRALCKKAEEHTVLHTRDGLDIAIRQNRWDAEIVREIFFRKPYTRRTVVGTAPIVVDIGGYIGDFALYALRYLGAQRVIVVEPTHENFEMLQRNVAINGFEDRVTAVNAAVGPPGELTLFVQTDTAGEIHASSQWYSEHEQRTVASIPLAELLATNGVDRVDLLKVDCEGGEYAILTDAPADVLDRIENIVFEYHEVDDYQSKLERILDRLTSAGFALHRDGHIISATRVGASAV